MKHTDYKLLDRCSVHEPTLLPSPQFQASPLEDKPTLAVMTVTVQQYKRHTSGVGETSLCFRATAEIR